MKVFCVTQDAAAGFPIPMLLKKHFSYFTNLLTEQPVCRVNWLLLKWAARISRGWDPSPPPVSIHKVSLGLAVEFLISPFFCSEQEHFTMSAIELYCKVELELSWIWRSPPGKMTVFWPAPALAWVGFRRSCFWVIISSITIMATATNPSCVPCQNILSSWVI